MRGLIQRFQTFSLLPEWVLIKRAKLGEKEAFGRLYEVYLDRLYRYIFYRVGNNRELAEDLVQSVFVKAWEKLDTFQKGSFQAWLYTITKHNIIDYIRAQKKQISLDETIADEKEAIEEGVHKKLEMQRIQHALKFLTVEQREIIILKFVEELPNQEIAKIVNKNETAIRALQYRALKELRKILSYEK